MYDWLTLTHGVVVSDDAVKGHEIWKKEKLEIFDQFIGDMILAGYYVESIGVNPQVRSAWKSYSIQLLIREHRARSNEKTDSIDSQTDRHEEDVATEFNLPVVINADD